MTAPALQQYVQGDGTVSADNLNSFEQTCDTVGQLREFIGTAGMQVFVRGLETPGDGGAGVFYWVEDGTDTDNGVTVIVPDGADGLWLRLGVMIVSTQTILTGSSIDLTSGVQLVYVAKTVGGATTLVLPLDPIPNLPLLVLDAKGDAASNPITVDGNGKTINGAATSTINTAYGSGKYVYSAVLSAWFSWT